MNRRELARQLERLQPCPQILPHLAADLTGMRDHLIEAAVLTEPLRGSLRPDFLDARNVVRAVPDERQVVDDLLRVNVELRLDSVAVEQRIAHRVDARDRSVDELGHVLVAGRDHHAQSSPCSTTGQCADHIVGFHAFHAQDGKSLGANDRKQGLDLRSQIVGHGLAVSLVLGKQIVSEGLARRVEHHRNTLGLIVLHELQQHVQHAVDGPGGLAARVRERRQGVEGPVHIR